jgi:mannose-1-phosphate guanylyltransferase/mannose-6-phosphate isomerase
MGSQSLLQETAGRLKGDPFGPAIVVSGEEQRFFVKRQLQDVSAEIDAVLLEPSGRNTAAAAALAAAWLCRGGRDEMLLLMPSDHVIGDREAFMNAVETGLPHAEAGAIVTFGAQPTGPNTQYGYIESAPAAGPASGAYPIARFHEKPDAENAANYVQTGRFFWNAGIFLMKASTVIEEMRQLLPASLDSIMRSLDGATVDGLFVRPAADDFNQAENISIDHGIMERTSLGIVVPVQMDWSDVGSWDAVWELGRKDSENNVAQGEVVAIGTKDSLLRSDGGPLIAAVGLDQMAVIAVRDAVLVAPLDRVSDLKPLVEELKIQHADRVLSPQKVARPWGSYETVTQGPRFQVKHIIIEPGESLSLQMHDHRSEHWVVVRGSAEVTIGDQVSILEENESTYIPAGTKHRLTNAGKVPLELVEVQCGSYLGEDDILRFDDCFGRTEAPKNEG